MAELSFTPEIFEQTDLVQEECRKLQALLDDNVQTPPSYGVRMKIKST
jgi:hypothetical protein